MDNSHLTTISELTPHTVYTIRVQAFTSVGPGPISAPVQVKTQQGEFNSTYYLAMINILLGTCIRAI